MFYTLLGGSPDTDNSGMVWFQDTAVQVWRGEPTSNVRLSINAENPTAIAATLTAEGHHVEWTDEQERRAFTTTDPDGNTVQVRDSDCWHR